MASKRISSSWVAGQATQLLRKFPLVQRAEQFGERAARRVGQQVANLVDPLPIASKRDLARIDRRLTRLIRKLRALDTGHKGPSTGSTTPPPSSPRTCSWSRTWPRSTA